MKKLIIILFTLLFLCSCVSNKQEEVTPEPIKEKEYINGEYPEIEGECVIYKASKEDVLKMLKHGTGVVFFSWIDCPWCHRYVNNVNKACRDNGIEVLYYDIYDDRDKNTDFYKEVKELLNKPLEEENSFDSDGNTRIYVPNIYFVSNGEVLGHNNESSMESGFEENAEKYWAEIMAPDNKTREELLIENLNAWAKEVKTRKDEIDSKGCDTDSACKL